MLPTLLLADSNTTIQRLVSLMFANEGIEVRAVDDGDAALAVFAQDPPDIILADVATPGRSAYELTEHVRQTEALRHVPVLLLAGAFDGVDRDRALAVGADGVLTKPFDPPVVIARVRELLERGHLAPGARRAPVSDPAAAPVPPTVALASAPEFTRPSPAAGAIGLTAAEPLQGEWSPEGDVAASAHLDDSSPTPLTEPGASTSGAPSATANAPEVDRYFAQLDEAFAALVNRPRTTALSPDDEEIATPSPAVPASAEAASPAAPGIEPAETGDDMGLADVFTALLESERTGDAPILRGLTPAPPQSLDMEAVVGEVTRRVIRQLTERVVRDAVVEAVADAAERLVREEIERIKRHIP